MSGHSKWSQIKRQKAVTDAKRGDAFTKLGREITVSAREGGADPEANFRLRLAIQRARESNMPADNIERAIKRGAGLVEGESIEEFAYEAYGPGGAALYVEITTDNRNRASAEVRNILTRAGGSLGESGSVAWLFEPQGLITVEAGVKDPDEVALIAIDAGADDVGTSDSGVEIKTSPSQLEDIRKALTKHNLQVVSAERAMTPRSTIILDEATTHQIMRLIEKLEELDDVRRVYTNIELTAELVESYQG